MSLVANGYVGGIQMTIVHDNNFKINLTNDALHADYITEGNKTTLIVVIPDSEEIFAYSGDFEITDMIVANSNTEIEVNLPKGFALSTAYPNPFNPTTSINLHVPMESSVNVDVFDLSGRLVESLLSGVQAKGDYNLTWNAVNEASGMYIVRAQTFDAVSVQKILLLK